MHNQKIKNALLKNLIIWFLMLSVLICAMGNSLANAQDKRENILKNAQDKYEKGYFDQVISMIDSSLSNNKAFTDPDKKAEAYALLARSYIALDYPESMAENTVKKLLELNKNYVPATPMDPGFLELVRRIQEQRRIEDQRKNQKTKSNLKYWILGGAVATSIAAITIWVLKQKEQKQLPRPPSHPGK